MGLKTWKHAPDEKILKSELNCFKTNWITAICFLQPKIDPPLQPKIDPPYKKNKA